MKHGHQQVQKSSPLRKGSERGFPRCAVHFRHTSKESPLYKNIEDILERKIRLGEIKYTRGSLKLTHDIIPIKFNTRCVNAQRETLLGHSTG